MEKQKKELIIIWIIIFASVVFALATNGSKTKLVLDAHASEGLTFGEGIIHDLQEDPIYTLGWDTTCPWHDGSQMQQNYICYAWKISGGDKDFILTLKAENGNIDPYTQSKYINKYGYREQSYGFCQIHSPSHPAIYNNPQFFEWKWQLDMCWNLYSDFKKRGIVGQRFFGWWNRNLYVITRNFKF